MTSHTAGAARGRGGRGRVVGALAVLAASLVFVDGPAGAAFPGVNGLLACQTTRTGNGEVFTFDPTGTEKNPVNLTNNPAADGRPKWSPDGRKIAFESNRDGNTEVWIMNANGSNPTQLTFTASGSNSPGSWHPDGSAITFQSTRDGNFEVYKVNIDGTELTRLTNLAVEDSLPAWSPDGTTIAFSSRRQDPAADVHLMDPDGNVFFNLTNSPGEDSWPDWSPDATQLSFHSRLDDPMGEEIYRIGRDGTGRTRLTFSAGGIPEAFDLFPHWSPDGTRIAWTSGRQGDNFGEIYHMRSSDGGDIRRVTMNAAIDQRCDWQQLCTIYGAGNITGTPGNDVICGSEGSDAIAGGGGNDVILGLGGADRVSGDGGNDRVFGGFGDDQVVGGDGDDIVSGGPGTDSVIGNAGTDHGDGGYGTDGCFLNETTRACP
ncbi:MAG: DPP IV N-terminal domain-containing protein [Acidimicrobiales bacterium]